MLDDALAAIRGQAAAFVADLVADPFATIEQVEHEAELDRPSDADFAAAGDDPIFEAYGVRSRDCCGCAAGDQDDTPNDLPDDEPESSAGDPAAASGRLITGPTQSAAVERGVEAAQRRGVRGGRKHRRDARADSPCHTPADSRRHTGPDGIRSHSHGQDCPCHTPADGRCHTNTG
jgi:hypothetical protein